MVKVARAWATVRATTSETSAVAVRVSTAGNSVAIASRAGPGASTATATAALAATAAKPRSRRNRKPASARAPRWSSRPDRSAKKRSTLSDVPPSMTGARTTDSHTAKATSPAPSTPSRLATTTVLTKPASNVAAPAMADPVDFFRRASGIHYILRGVKYNSDNILKYC
ncbi:hypothetical protein SI859A1_02112 [Aurantimonas manganoxydans SI85-9A1]|uniref:Uncharacterized protein n=1 Tax=Aurantimonas manganoxydans (strain ATCC BAA-1229 / DSM 21871 / SI85-9A1) TaxID=287752 RepID=Q1YMT4_AURMS|nr:hypothetical protein SI859A1_02112 [Aurantimonas manganoxydans SI85-9A1]